MLPLYLLPHLLQQFEYLACSAKQSTANKSLLGLNEAIKIEVVDRRQLSKPTKPPLFITPLILGGYVNSIDVNTGKIIHLLHA
jgi:hypothetical protein